MIILFRSLVIFCLVLASFPANAASPDDSLPAMSAALTAFSQGQGMGHPRLLKGQADFAGIVATDTSSRIVGLKAMEAYLHRASVRSTDTSFLINPSGSDNLANLNTWFKQERVLEGMAETALAWYVTRDTWYLDELRARANIFLPQIMGIQCKAEATKTRAYAWYFSLAYDFAFAGLTPKEKSQFREVVKTCANTSLNSIVKDVSTDAQNGIAFHALGKYVGALLIVLGDMPEAQVWLQTALPTYVANLSPWGGTDGGYANGTSYAEWDTGESLLTWDLLDRVLGIPIYQKPWVEELPRFLTYTLPPGAPIGVFGDGAEVNRKEEWARFGKSLMSRYSTPLARWYERQLFGDDPSRLNNLLSPGTPTAAALWPTGEPDSRLFPSIGWAAMHSAMVDRSRVSVYFKSSPYGSLNHSHADQNSFVIHAHGRVIAMDSGVYDYYDSPHWRDWYKHTRAHNAITYDGGLGQNLGLAGLGSKELNGKIEKFTTSASFDLVEGDATVAYQGALTKAKRWVALLRPNTVVVVDQLSARTPRRWEWNYHTTSKPSLANGVLTYNAEGVSTCVRTSSPKELNYTQSEGYAPSPQTTAPYPSHFGNRFSYAAPATEGIFISVISVDCDGIPPAIDWLGNVATVRTNGKQLVVSGDDVSIQ